MARPKAVLDPAEVERLAGEGLAEYQIAQAIGVAWNTYARCKDEQTEVAEALKRGQRCAIGKVENALFTSAVGGNLGAQVFFLKNRASDQWRDKMQQELTGKDGGPLETKSEVSVRPPISRDEWLKLHGLDPAEGTTTSGT